MLIYYYNGTAYPDYATIRGDISCHVGDADGDIAGTWHCTCTNVYSGSCVRFLVTECNRSPTYAWIQC